MQSFSLFKVASSSAERVSGVLSSAELTMSILPISISFYLFTFSVVFRLVCDNIKSVEKEDVCNLKGTVMQTEKLPVNNR